MDRGAWWATVSGVAKSQMCLSMHAYAYYVSYKASKVAHVPIKTLPSEETFVESVLNFRYRKAVLFFPLCMSFPMKVCKTPANWGGFSSWKVLSFEKGGKLFKLAWPWAVDLPMVRLAGSRSRCEGRVEIHHHGTWGQCVTTPGTCRLLRCCAGSWAGSPEEQSVWRWLRPHLPGPHAVCGR